MLPTFSPTQVILSILLMAWLGICVAFDLHSRQVPTVLTITPLVLSAIWRLFQGEWPLVLLVVALILISDFPGPKWRIPLACLAGLLALSFHAIPENNYAILVVFVAWALWEIGATGGADAKIIISLVLMFGNGLLFIPIVLAGGIQGLIGMLTKKKTIPYTVAITLGTAAWLWMSVGR
jgi:Flp pilus assembly protein protease CpaA